MSAPSGPPPWYQPGMSEAEIRVWEAAERAADAAPEIQRGDDIALQIQALFRDFPERLRECRAQQQDTAA